MLNGRCHCGAIRYQMPEAALNHTLCHCTDCRRHAGAPMVGWIMAKADDVKIEGRPRTYASSEHGRRLFCADCGTGLFYINEAILPGVIDVQSGTLDEPDRAPPSAHIQWAERIGWMEGTGDLPRFERWSS